jgi:hypothetical protein
MDLGPGYHCWSLRNQGKERNEGGLPSAEEVTWPNFESMAKWQSEATSMMGQI